MAGTAASKCALVAPDPGGSGRRDGAHLPGGTTSVGGWKKKIFLGSLPMERLGFGMTFSRVILSLYLSSIHVLWPSWWYFRLIFLSEFYWKAQAVYMQGSNVRDVCCFLMKVLCLVTQSCLTLCDPMDCRSLPGSSVHGDSPGKNTRVGCHALFQGIFPTRRSNPGLPHFGQTLTAKPPGSILCWVSELQRQTFLVFFLCW